VVGANAGTTVTGLIASIPLGTTARRTALANLGFNAAGVLAFAPFIRPFADWVATQAESTDIAVALAHLIFNLAIAAFFLPWTRLIARLLEPAP
ncbi:MAG: Na/Pi symporter, partial [Gammaproteobacteria bacterium]|nr:Na/Pi symporter [Gammaproteobacteria bacterium]